MKTCIYYGPLEPEDYDETAEMKSPKLPKDKDGKPFYPLIFQDETKFEKFKTDKDDKAEFYEFEEDLPAKLKNDKGECLHSWAGNKLPKKPKEDLEEIEEEIIKK